MSDYASKTTAELLQDNLSAAQGMLSNDPESAAWSYQCQLVIRDELKRRRVKPRF